jgi:hypothetical protein
MDSIEEHSVIGSSIEACPFNTLYSRALNNKYCTFIYFSSEHIAVRICANFEYGSRRVIPLWIHHTTNSLKVTEYLGIRPAIPLD